MKSIFAFLLVFALLFALTACDKKPTPSTEPTQEPYDDGNNAVNDDPEATQSRPTDPTNDPHFHNYTSAVTKEATCTVEGELTYSCACGDSYTEVILVTEHNWGEWEVVTPALVGKPGIEKRSCIDCNEPVTRERTANAIANSFYDGGLIRIIGDNYGTISTRSLLEYASRQFHEYADKPVAIDTICDALAQRFDMSNFDLSEIFDNRPDDFYKERWGYDEANNTLTLHDYGDTATLVLLGYVHKEGKLYDTYYAFTPDGIDATVVFKVELEYNLPDGKPNRYFAIHRLDSLSTQIFPEEMVKCPEGEICELGN